MNFLDCHISEKSKEYAKQVLDSGLLSEGEWVRKFERAISVFHGYPTDTVVCTNSGTSALHLALRALGVGEGDEIIIPPLTFVATGLAVLYCGAKPVFSDIGEDGNIDIRYIKEKITPKTKAVLAVNWAGRDCHSELYEMCQRYGLKLIVDAAQAFGTFSTADAICFSFQATKHVTAGDGGAVYFRDPKDYERGRRLSWFGIDRENDKPDILGERVYDLSEIGHKYHMNNLSAAVGLGNIESADWILSKRSSIVQRYYQELHSVKFVETDDQPRPCWAFPVKVLDVRRFSLYCSAIGVPCSILHRGIDRNKIFGGMDVSLIKMREWEQTVTHLPVHLAMSNDDLDFIIEKVNEYAE